jgi:hypothetical protein
VSITATPLHGGEDTTLTQTPDAVHLTPIRGADWLHRVSIEIHHDRVIVSITPKDPRSPINTLTVRPDGSAVFAT